MIARLCAAAAAACIAVLASGTASWAGQGHDKPAVCHPKAGGWVLIRPAQASSHIDERSGAPKHEHGGRVDVYAVNGACPTPTTTPTGGTPSATTTTTVTPTSATSTKTSSPSTTSVPSPSKTSSTPTTRATGPATVTSSSPVRTTSTYQSRSTASAPPSIGTAHSRLTSKTSSTTELAYTGSDLSTGVAVALFLLATGGLLIRRARKTGAHR
jgi:hypothetical protein